MAQKYANVNRKSRINKNTFEGRSACLACGKHLAYCGEPFSAEISCPSCGAVNIYVDSQQPSGLRGQSEGHKAAQQHSV